MDTSPNPAQIVAEELRVAFAAVGAADIPAEQKGRWQHRLIAITNMSKRDVARAQEQLRRFNDDWRVGMSTTHDE